MRPSIATRLFVFVVGLPALLAACSDAPVDGVGAGTTAACEGPDIHLWYGDDLYPDSIGHPQHPVNVLGNVSARDGLDSLRYALNGGSLVEAPVGPDGLRLQNAGDFNIGIDRAALAEGANSLELLARDTTGAVCSRGVTIHHDGSATRIVSSEPADELIDAVATTNEITVEAWLVSADLEQDGPARIVSISESPHFRNVTLGQGLWGGAAADRIDARLRTTATNDNGQPSLTTGAGTLVSALTHVVYTRDTAGVARIYIDGIERASQLVDGDLSAWDSGQLLLLGNEIDGSRPWLGALHLVAVFDRALLASEVAHNFAAGPG